MTDGTLIRVCPSCRADNRPIARLCDQCGAELVAQLPPERVPEERYADVNRPGVLAARVLHQTYSVSDRLIEYRLRGAGLSYGQFRALSIVKLMPAPLTLGVLALRLALDPRTVSDLIGRLELCGWIRRMRDLPDRRAVRLELTEEGEAKLAHVWGPMVQAIEEAWQLVPEDDLLPLVRSLLLVRDNCLGRLGYSPDDIFALGPRLPAE